MRTSLLQICTVAVVLGSAGCTPEGGGTTGTGGTSATSGGTGPVATGGVEATGGKTTATGGTGTGGRASGGAATGGGSAVNCSAAMPTGGTDHCGANTQGTADGLSWQIWSNNMNSSSCMTTYSSRAFGARWSNAGDFLARFGLQWSSPPLYTQYETITAQFSFTKTGTAGGYSYIGVYGFSDSPCVEFYIVEDSFNAFPFNAYNATLKGTVSIDGENYKLFSNTVSSTGDRCGGGSGWKQFWSIRQTARQCGTISITQHFDAWQAAGMTLGNLLEVTLLVESGGGTGNIDFAVANVTAQ